MTSSRSIFTSFDLKDSNLSTAYLENQQGVVNSNYTVAESIDNFVYVRSLNKKQLSKSECLGNSKQRHV